MRDDRPAPPRWRPAVSRMLPLLLALAVLAAACAPGEPAADPQETPAPDPPPEPVAAPGVLYVFARQPEAITPPAAVDGDELTITDQLFDPLTAVDPDLAVVPAVAREWETNEDATVHTFRLREDATFHDGTPVTAAAFVRGWERIADRDADPPSAAHHLLDPVEGIDAAREGEALTGAEAVDEHTLRVTLSEPFAEFPAVVSHPSLAPLPEGAQRVGDFDRMPIGNGPFRMVEPWQPGQFVRMEPFPDHPEANHELDQLVFRIYEGDGAAREAYEDFLRGRLHLVPVADEELQDAIAEHGTVRGHSGPGVVAAERLMTVYYAFNVDIAPFDEPAVRRAIALSIDPEGVLEVGDGEGRVGASSLVPPDLPRYPPADCAVCEHDPAQAVELLEDVEAELETIELTVHRGGDHVEVAERVRRDIEWVLGAGTVEVRALPTSEWLEEIRAREAGFFLSGWEAEYPSPGAFLDPLFHPARQDTDGLTGYTDEDVEEWLEAARGTVAAEERYALYRRVEERILDDGVIIPLYRYRHARVLSELAPGIVVGPTGLLDLSDARLADNGT